MLHLLRRHALAVQAHLKSALVLTYAMKGDSLDRLLPPGLELDRFDDWGFLAVGLVEARELRPQFLPKRFGMDFSLAGYRIFARYRTVQGRTLRGLRILRSDTDRRRMQVLGSLFTHYRFALSRWTVQRSREMYAVEVKSSDGLADLQVEAALVGEDRLLPEQSPFADLRQARRFAGPLPFTFGYEDQTRSIIRVEGARQNWNPRPVAARVHRNTFLEQSAFRDAGPVLACAFFIENVPYRWRPGVCERIA